MQNFRPFLDTVFTIPAFLCAAGPQDTAYGTKPGGQVCGTLQKDCAVADGRRFRGTRGMIRDGFGWFGAVLGACGTAGGSVEGQPAFFRGQACPLPEFPARNTGGFRPPWTQTGVLLRAACFPGRDRGRGCRELLGRGRQHSAPSAAGAGYTQAITAAGAAFAPPVHSPGPSGRRQIAFRTGG